MFEPLIPPRQFNVRTDDFAQSSLHASFYPQRPQQPETPDDYLYLQPIATSARMIKSIAPKGEIADGRSSWVPETARVQPNKNKLTLQKTTRKSHKVEKKRDSQGPRSPHYKSILPYLIGSTSHSPGTKRTERDPFMDAKAVSDELAAFERNAGSAAPPAGGTLPPLPFQQKNQQRRHSVVAKPDNPLAGLMCGVPLHVVYEKYKNMRLAMNIARCGDHVSGSEQLKVLLTLQDFQALISLLVPNITISEAYAEHIFSFFVSTGSVLPRRAPFRDIFCYLARTSGHPMVEKNVKFFFACMDEADKGAIPAKMITASVVLAWAENRVVGRAIFHWRAVGAALRCAPLNVPEGQATLDIDDVRVAVNSSKPLSDAFEKDLDCVLTDSPRFPLLPRPAPPPLYAKYQGTSQSGMRHARSFGSRSATSRDSGAKH